MPVDNSPVALPLLLTVHQASQLIGVSRTTMHKLMDTGQLFYVHIGASRRVPLQAAHDYLTRLCASQHRSGNVAMSSRGRQPVCSSRPTGPG